jgi:hypothetical protein
MKFAKNVDGKRIAKNVQINNKMMTIIRSRFVMRMTASWMRMMTRKMKANVMLIGMYHLKTKFSSRKD